MCVAFILWVCKYWKIVMSICDTLENSGEFFLKFFLGGNKSFLWGHWCPCFGLLVTSPCGFKARVDSLICTWQRLTCDMFPEIHLWCNTCWPLVSQHGCSADLFHIPVIRHWWGSKLGSIMLLLTVWDQTDALPTELCWLGSILVKF